MKRMTTFLPALILAALVLASTVWAETKYVTDQLVLTLREKPSESSKILTTFSTGTPLKVLGSQGEYLRVRTQEGDEGYVLERYLTAETPKPEIIARLEEEKMVLTEKLNEVESTLANLEQKDQSRKTAEESLSQKNARA